MKVFHLICFPFCGAVDEGWILSVLDKQSTMELLSYAPSSLFPPYCISTPFPSLPLPHTHTHHFSICLFNLESFYLDSLKSKYVFFSYP